MEKETGGEKKDQMSGRMLSRSRFLTCSRNSVQNDEYYLLEVKSGKSRKMPRAMMEFEKKYKGQLSVVGKRIINQSAYLEKDNTFFYPPIFCKGVTFYQVVTL